MPADNPVLEIIYLPPGPWTAGHLTFLDGVRHKLIRLLAGTDVVAVNVHHSEIVVPPHTKLYLFGSHNQISVNEELGAIIREKIGSQKAQ